jgi:hypothetical protein
MRAPNAAGETLPAAPERHEGIGTDIVDTLVEGAST